MDIAAVRTAYRRYARVYDPVFGGVFLPGRKRTIDQVNRHGGRRVLEIGVGTGLALPAYRRDLRIVGIDASPEMLRLARRRVSRDGLHHVTSLEEMDARDMGFADDSFDVVVAMFVMSVVPEPRRVLAEASRVCKPDGEILICNHFASERTGNPRHRVERAMAPLAEHLGWHPDFPMGALLPYPGIEVARVRRVPPFGLFTLLECRNAKAAPERQLEIEAQESAA